MAVVADTSVSPEGRASATATACAALGPVLVTVTVKVTLAPTAGVALSTTFVTARSASFASTIADAELFAGVGSYVDEVAVAVLVTAVCEVTVATIVSVALAPFARFPTAQMPVPLLYEPVDGLDDTSARPAGSTSVTATAWAVSGPAFATVTVKVTLAPTSGVGTSTLLLTDTFASGTLTVADPLSLPGAGS